MASSVPISLRQPSFLHIQAAASSVLESIIDRPRKHHSSENTISIPGLESSYCIMVEFVLFRCTEEQMDKYGIHLLALSHVYSVTQLKQRCTKGLAERLTVDNVVDVLQLARLCDAPDLKIKCMRLLSKNFKSVEGTEGWKFLHDNDPWLELEILQFMDEAALRKRGRRNKDENLCCS
ncbi:hypothetical protein Leryth_026800 [Lithospermum erythrorhizon]|nr:hypothetical protein Leryth_026800 [Lithospermum erythrorhizon]